MRAYVINLASCMHLILSADRATRPRTIIVWLGLLPGVWTLEKGEHASFVMFGARGRAL